MIFTKLFLFIVVINVIQSSESPGFFLKVSKNVPRIGRRSGSDFDNFFLKQSKNVPRIGRRDGYVDNSFPEESVPWYQTYLKESKRALGGPQYQQINDMDYDFDLVKNYNNIQPIDDKFLTDVLSEDLPPPTNDLRFVSWKDFDQALEKDGVLYRKLSSLAKDKELEDLIMMMDKAGGKIANQYAVSRFVPMGATPMHTHKNEATFYRTQRSEGKEGGLKKLTKEQVAYNYQQQH